MVKRGFTLIELILVLAIIGLLFGLSAVAGHVMLGRRDYNTTQTLISAVTVAIASYPVQSLSVQVVEGGAIRDVTYPRMWDMNQLAFSDHPGDGLIDGYPAVAKDAAHDGPFWNGLVTAGYRGFVAMAMPDLPQKRRNAIGQPIDAWGYPLHISFGGHSDGATGFRVWSCGPDGISATADDIPQTGRP